MPVTAEHQQTETPVAVAQKAATQEGPKTAPKPPGPRAGTVQRIMKLSETSLEAVVHFLSILERDRGSDTPFEDFITGLVHMYGYFDGAITPAMVEKDLEEFRMRFDESLGITRDFMRRHAAIVLKIVDPEDAPCVSAASKQSEELQQECAANGDSVASRLAATRRMIAEYPGLVFAESEVA